MLFEKRKLILFVKQMIPGGILWLLMKRFLIGCLRHTHSSVLLQFWMSYDLLTLFKGHIHRATGTEHRKKNTPNHSNTNNSLIKCLFISCSQCRRELTDAFTWVNIWVLFKDLRREYIGKVVCLYCDLAMCASEVE